MLFLLLLVASCPVQVASQQDQGYARVVVVRLAVPAVHVASTGKYVGVVSNLTVAVAWPGRGIVYFSAEPLTELDTQAAARVAALIASIIAGVDYGSYDFFIRLETESSTIGGPSASAAMAVAILAALRGKTLPENASMTGMIEPDGTIGPVGGVPVKLEAVAKRGVKVFLIPRGQETSVDPNTGRRVDVVVLGKELGVEVKPVGSIVEAYALLTGDRISVPVPKLSYPEWLRESLLSATETFSGIASSNISRAKALLERLPESVGKIVNESLAKAEEALKEASELKSRGMYYAAASRAFYAALEACYASGLASAGLRGLEAGRSLVLDLISATRYNLAQAMKVYEEYRRAKLTDVTLQLLITLYARLRATNETLKLIPKEGSLADMIRDACYAYLRSITALQWAELATKARGGLPINSEQLRRGVYTIVEYAELVANYLAVLAGVAPITTMVSEAKTLLSRGDYIAAAGLAVEALSRYSIAMHHAFNTTSVLAPYAEQVVGLLVHRVEQLGATPILPLAYIELTRVMKEASARISLCEDAAAYTLLLYASLARAKTATPPPPAKPGVVTKTVTVKETVTVTLLETTTTTKTVVVSSQAPAKTVTETVTKTVTLISPTTTTTTITKTVGRTVEKTVTVTPKEKAITPTLLAAVLAALAVGLVAGAAVARASRRE